MNLLQWIEHATERSMAIDCLYLEGSVFLFSTIFLKNPGTLILRSLKEFGIDVDFF